MSNDPQNEIPRKQPIRGYEILERIGSGGMGTIYRARQLSMNRIVALKVLKKSELRDALPLDRLRREAMLIARMDHPNIVKGIDMGETDRYYFFAMDYIEGRSVKSILDLYGVMDELKAASIVREVVRALQYAHRQKLTHRDIKPGNILISSAGQTKLTDLGLAKRESDLTITREGTTVGTPQYIAPEQARNPNAADIRSDIYSLGATHYHMVTGRMPFEGETMAEVLTKVLFSRPPLPEAVRPGVSYGTSRVISRMMAKDPRRRYQTPDDLLDDLDVLIEALKDGSRELANLIGMTWKDSQRSRLPRLRNLVMAVCGVLVIGTVLFFLFRPGGSDVQQSSVDLNTGLRGLMTEYDNGKIKAGPILERMLMLPHGYDQSVMETFRGRVHREIRQIMSEILSPQSSRFDRALAEGGFAEAHVRYRRIAALDATEALGEHPGRLPAGLQTIWNEKVGGALASLAKRVEEERSTLLEQAALKVAADSEAIRDRIDEGALRESWQGLSRMKTVSGSYLEDAARMLSGQIAAVAGRGKVDANLFMDKNVQKQFRTRVDRVVADLTTNIRMAFTNAADAHLKDVTREAIAMIQEASPALIDKGLDGIIARAVMQAQAKPVFVPKELELDLPGPGVLRETLNPAFEARKDELKSRHKEQFREDLLADIDTRIFEGNFAAALKAVRDGGADPAADPNYLERWRQMIHTLDSLDDAVFEGLSDWKGIRTDFRTTKGVRYTGTITQVDRPSATVRLELDAGQPVNLKFSDLVVEDALAWIQKAKAIDPWCKGLYSYSRKALEQATVYLAEDEDFEDAPWFLKRIQERIDRVALTREAADRDLKQALEEVDAILAQGDWRQGDLKLKEITKQYGSAQARQRRKEIREKIAALEKEEAEQERIKRFFSVPVEIRDDGKIRVTYSFDVKSELEDFEALGQNWSIMEGRLWCGAGRTEGNLDFYHNTVGVRFGEAFDPAAPFLLTFIYRPPLEGQCPCFMGVSFFGRCVGIRSFPDGKHEGQVNAWAGDLDDYGEYFYFPDLGEERPKKGKLKPFSFQRGERYEIQFIWSPGRELLFKVDGSDIYRLPAFKPEPGGIEIKTLKNAIIERITIEGELKGD